MHLAESERGGSLVLLVAGTEERPGLKDQNEVFQKGRPGQTELQMGAGCGPFWHFGRTLLSYIAAGLALTWSFTKIIVGVEAHGIVVLFSSR